MRNTLVVRPDPIRRAISYFVFATVFLGFGVPVLFGKQSDVEHGARVIPIIFGGVFTAGAVGMYWTAYRSMATRVHLELDEFALDLRWTRFGKETKHERVPRAQLVDVGVKDSPASGNDYHCVVIGTRNGDIELSNGHQGALGFFVRKSEEVARFLSVPVRPR